MKNAIAHEVFLWETNASNWVLSHLEQQQDGTWVMSAEDHEMINDRCVRHWESLSFSQKSYFWGEAEKLLSIVQKYINELIHGE